MLHPLLVGDLDALIHAVPLVEEVLEAVWVDLLEAARLVRAVSI